LCRGNGYHPRRISRKPGTEPTIPEMPPFETIYVESDTVACNGGGGPLGHPRVYLSLAAGRVECPYCSRLYIRREGRGAGQPAGDGATVSASSPGS
jgi:uncharacterized Zn-finger protein